MVVESYFGWRESNPRQSRPFMEVGRDALALLPFNAVLPYR